MGGIAMGTNNYNDIIGNDLIVSSARGGNNSLYKFNENGD